MISRFRPRGCIIGAAHYESTYRKLLLSFGVRPIWIGAEQKESVQMVKGAINIAIDEKLIDAGDEIVTVASTPPLRPGTTNMIQILVAEKKQG